MLDEPMAVCTRCGRETSQADLAFTDWEVVSGDVLVCDHCLTREEEQALTEQAWEGEDDAG